MRLGTVVQDLGLAGAGINKAVRAIVRTDSGDAEAFVKQTPSRRELLVELACATLARLLDLPVPEPLLVLVPEQFGGPVLAYGSLAVDQPNLSTFVTPQTREAVFKRLKRWGGLIPAACFDEWIANCDRHDQNLLFNGIADFWLIDHGLSVHEGFPVDRLAPRNQLFEMALDGKSEAELLSLLPVALGVMQAFSARDARLARDKVFPLKTLWSEPVFEDVFKWLTTRQAHLVRLASERIPTRQGGLFT